METTMNAATQGNLNQPMQSALFVPMDSIKGKAATIGHRFARLIKRGEGSKLAESVAIEVPVLKLDIEAIAANGHLAAYVTDCITQLQDSYLKSRSVAGLKQVQYEELTLDKLAQFLAEDTGSIRMGQLSEERIGSWFDNDGARDLLLVALADKMGVSETATPDELKRLEQIANQTRDHLKKLASKKPVVFDARVKDALNRVLNIVDMGDAMTTRLRDKLNVPAPEAIDIVSALGL